MSQNNDLPFLPGYTYDLNPKKYHGKQQTFAVKNGVMMSGCEHFRGRPKRADESSFGIPRSDEWDADMDWQKNNEKIGQSNEPPEWQKTRGKVLRFYAYTQEAVHASNIENYRVRKVVIYYFLEDGSMSIVEPKVDNSGLPQGVLIKRHRVSRDGVSNFLPSDFAIGREVKIYARVYRIVDCDVFTRNFFEENGLFIGGEPEDYPVDPYSAHTESQKRTKFNKLRTAEKVYHEASSGRTANTVNVAKTTQFLKNDGKILRFYATWTDPSLYGERHPYVINYFLADDTVQVNEIKEANSGHDPFPCLLKRCKLPKNFHETQSNVSTIGGAMDGSTIFEFIRWPDIHVGMDIDVFGRKLVICGADAYTQQFYIDNAGASPDDFTPISMPKEVKTYPRMPTPPYNGFGTEEDSLGSFRQLVPKPPRKDVRKLIEKDGMNMRFLAKFAEPSIEDVDRLFVVTYYLADDTIGVFEKVVRNSGFTGGKFLERSRLKNAATGRFFHPGDLAVGDVVTINGFKFRLIEQDKHTENYMREHPEEFVY